MPVNAETNGDAGNAGNAGNGKNQNYLTLDLQFDPANPQASGEAIIRRIYPHITGAVHFQAFKEGITNTLLKCTLGVGEEEVLLRAYGNCTSILIDRQTELRNHLLLQRHGLAPRLIARFANGLVYPYQPGRALRPVEMPLYAGPIARKLAAWHRLPCSDHSELWTTLLKWTAWLKAHDEPEAEAFEREISALQQQLNDVGPIIAGHNDLLSGNIILLDPPSPATNGSSGAGSPQNYDAAAVTFVDFEYGCAVNRGYDIANHFNEWGGFECEFWRMPGHPTRHAWIQTYLGPSATDAEVKQVVQEVEAFWGAPHLYWAIWARIQAHISTIDFDYKTYSRKQVAEYYAWRKTGATIIPRPKEDGTGK